MGFGFEGLGFRVQGLKVEGREAKVPQARDMMFPNLRGFLLPKFLNPNSNPPKPSPTKSSSLPQIRDNTAVLERRGLTPVFEAHRLLYHSTLGLRVIKKKKKAHGSRWGGQHVLA